ncbi:SLOG family protein [Periweissella beninensis]|uniref:UPF0398 protein KAK10_08920 n=1 Tax=Periweissella beninensis TaxID=504936 RepID=A0ABT0VK43_9LACO|nr:SLOG family protein [Periweissella beninensis]MBM7544522.1 putative phage-like protein YoqJ [Periweissella beninensis]MCM2438020.1 DUF1273 family protein [Periweissella beninensis]MCT4396937.1 DUF1273 family protein [Periweissella beninensis]
MQNIWLTGYRNYELGIFKNDDVKIDIIKYALKQRLIAFIEDGGKWILSGPQLGVEQWAIESALELKKEYNDLKVGLLLPFANFGKQWQQEKQQKLLNLKEQVDYWANVSDNNYQGPKQLQNYQKFMLEHTQGSILLYDLEREGKSQYDYQVISAYQVQHADYALAMLTFDDLQEYAQDFAEKQNFA